MFRREFLSAMGASVGLVLARPFAAPLFDDAVGNTTLHISPAAIEIAPHKTVKTIAYNGSAPGPFLRFREGQRVVIDVFNDSNDPELVHWHGLFSPPEVDGSLEEGTPLIPPKSSQRYSLIARPAGTRWYHTHMPAQFNLNRGIYTGQFGMLYIEPKNDPGEYDAESLLCLHGWGPYWTGEEGGIPDVGYGIFSINGRALGYGEPIRVREGQKVLFRILNASATLHHRIALAGHKFTVVSLDGNPVPTPRTVDVLSLGPAERVDAVVSMNTPGVWILGDVDNRIRNRGLGIVVEYRNKNDAARWVVPDQATWDYTLFGFSPEVSIPIGGSEEEAEVIPLVFQRKFAGKSFEHWTINGREYPKTDPITVRPNRRYLLQFNNQSDDAHPIHLHRHSFELRSVCGLDTKGVIKDVVVVPSRKTIAVELLADHPGPSLFHCHNQLHMDFGFMTLLQYTEERERQSFRRELNSD